MNRQRGFTVVELMAGLGILVWVAVLLAIIWVACHFISKFW